nr:hypothetical protein pE2022-8_00058 [Escherichia coli]
MNYAGHEKLRADVAEVANTMCDLRARLNDMEHRCRFDSDVLVERLTRQTLYRANRLFMEAYTGFEGQWNENVRLWYNLLIIIQYTKVPFQGPFRML